MGPLPWPAQTTRLLCHFSMYSAIDNTQASSEVCASKACFKCLEVKPLTAYYKHPQMGDGRLGKCKDCTKDDVKKDHYRKIADPAWAKSEQDRHRLKYHRLQYRGKHKQTPEAQAVSKAIYIERWPEKVKARALTGRLHGKDGKHMHHWSYAEGNAKDLIELDAKDHATVHRFIVYDQQEMAYRRKDNGELLATRGLHESYAFEILQSIAA